MRSEPDKGATGGRSPADAGAEAGAEVGEANRRRPGGVHQHDEAEEERRREAEEQRRRDAQLAVAIGHVRDEDIEPYTGLRWVGTVFKAAAIFLLVALVGEFVAGLRAEGFAALPTLLGETARTFVFMVVLWGGGDLVRLLVDVGHDIRAQRIFLTRLEWRTRDAEERKDA